MASAIDIDLIPEPQQLSPGQGVFRPAGSVCVVTPPDADAEDVFAAQDLARLLQSEHGMDACATRETAAHEATGQTILLERRQPPEPRPEGYALTVEPDRIIIRGNDAAGVFWATRTLLQAVRQGESGLEIPCMTVEDWPDLAHRAAHYDTKHHQGTLEYVADFIRTLARYKINMLVWEWEDKLAYERHPEVGAPGAYTKEQMRELTALALQHHIQLVPLVQGLGHVSFILKHPQHRHLREIPDSAWEFCPLNEGSYELLFDLWDEAMEATPGVEFVHIGSDETYELGLGEDCGCREQADAHGKQGLMHLFLTRCAEHVISRGRRPMCWAHAPRHADEVVPGMAFVDNSDVEALGAATRLGTDVFSYAPNPGIVPLFLGYFPWVKSSMWRDEIARVRKGSFDDTGATISAAAKAGVRLGSITTSWDDSGLHTQMWMPRCVCAAEYSWSANRPALDTWPDRFLRQYFGAAAQDLRELFNLLQRGALFYYDTFQRRVWHWGEIGRIHLPDFPRQEVEFNNYWRREYAQLLHRAQEERQVVRRALVLIDSNLAREISHAEDLEIYRSVAELMRHNVDLVLMLATLEGDIQGAHDNNFCDRPQALAHLQSACRRIQENLQDRARVFDDLVQLWEQTRLPKGMSTPDKAFVFAPDRARHFANRTPDMRYLIVDEELLDLEGYLARLETYTEEYAQRLLS